jgi:hypothetical protein
MAIKTIKYMSKYAKNTNQENQILKLLKVMRLLKVLADLNSKKKINDDQVFWSSFIYDVPRTPTEVIKGERENNYNKINKLFGQRPLVEPFEKTTEKGIVTTVLKKIFNKAWLEYLRKHCKNWLEIWISFCNEYPTLAVLVLGVSWFYFLLSLNNWIKKHTLKTTLRRLLQSRIPLWEYLHDFWFDFEKNEYERLKEIEYRALKAEHLRLLAEQYFIESKFSKLNQDVPLHIRLSRQKVLNRLKALFDNFIKENENKQELFRKSSFIEVAEREKFYDKVFDMSILDTESTADTITLEEFFDKHKIEPVTPETQKELITKLEQKRNETVDVYPSPIFRRKGVKEIKHLRKRKPSRKKK